MEDQNIKDAQYRKSLSIAFFNANNAAIEIVKTGLKLATKEEITAPGMDETVQRQIIFWRDWLLTQHRDYYATTILNAGEIFRVEETIAGLKKATTRAELKKKYLELSQDERNNDEVVKLVAEMKAQFAEQAPEKPAEAPAEEAKPEAVEAEESKVENSEPEAEAPKKKPKTKKNETAR